MDIDVVLLGKLLVAALLALPIAWDREARSRSMGLSTFPLVAVGDCACVLTDSELPAPDAPAAGDRIKTVFESREERLQLQDTPLGADRS